MKYEKGMKPMLFNGEMVRAILEGRKTVTRRPIDSDTVNQFDIDTDGTIAAFVEQSTGDSYSAVDVAKYSVGDILYVRETWRIGAWYPDDGTICVDYKADDLIRQEWIEVEDQERFEKYWFQSTDDAIKAGLEPDSGGEYHWIPGESPTRWRPSIHMPKEAARTFLKCTGVRVERLRDITDEDVTKEGLIVIPSGYSRNDYKFAYTELWYSIYGNKELNPWVFVYEFEVLGGD